MIKVFIQNKEFRNEIFYTFEVILNRLGISYQYIKNIDSIVKNDILINYGKQIVKREKTINIRESNLFNNCFYLKKISIPNKKLSIYNNIPVIYGENSVDIDNSKQYIISDVDIIQSIFFMLTRYEEFVLWDDIEKDIHGRFRAKDSLAYKENFLNYPIVDEYIEWFWKWIKISGYNGIRRRYFENYNFAACLTHDVDIPFKYKYSLFNEMKKLKNSGDLFRKYKDIIQHTKTIVNYKKDPYYTFDYIRSIEKKYDFSSSFYFMSGGNTKYDNCYEINDVRILALIKSLNLDKCEIGYHYSYNAYNNLNMRIEEKKKLDKISSYDIHGGRNHFLRFTPKKSWDLCEKTGLLYDSTLCYAEYIGFRCGTCFPYKTYSLAKRKKMDLWEIPLIIMEGTLNESKYMNLQCDEAFEEIKKKIDIIKKYNGVFTLLWHNSAFNDVLWTGWSKVFENTMLYLKQNNATGMSGIEIIKAIKD